MTTVLVLGSHGMLGSMVARVLGESPNLSVTVAARAAGKRGVLDFDAQRDSVEDLLSGGYAWIVNAIGIIKPLIDESDRASVARAIDVNAAFPYRLAAAARPGQRVIQIATDCVFSGGTGAYDEEAPHDPLDVYGKTKSLGEVAARQFMHLRCSIIGPELEAPRSLLGWLLSRPPQAQLPGFTNHRWNGVTTWHFARLCEAVISKDLEDLPSPLHVLPGDTVTKAELLELALHAFGRSDAAVVPGPAETAIDRTLSTRYPEANHRLWAAAGYQEPPTVATMLEELASRVTDAAGAR